MEKETPPQREHKDRLFKAIFGRDTAESKKWRLELYNALNGTQLTDPDELKVNTIENVIYIRANSIKSIWRKTKRTQAGTAA